MTLEKIIRSSLDDWTEDVPVPFDLSSSALVRARRQRSVRRLTAVSAAVLVAAAIAIPVSTGRPHGVSHQLTAAGGASGPGPTAWPPRDSHGQPALNFPTVHPPTTVSAPQPPSTPWTPLTLTHAHTGNTTISAHPNEAPPVHLVAAKDVALSAWAFLSHAEPHTRSWHLYNPGTGTYVQVPWNMLDVSPGLGLAAVLEGSTTSNRIGIVDLTTGSVIRWIPVAKPVGTVEFSPDGNTLVATTYLGDPGRDNGDDKYSPADGAITGFILINLINGYQTVVSSVVGFQESAYDGLEWTYDGRYLFVPNGDDSQMWFYTADGQAAAAPPHADLLAENNGTSANVSPDGTKALAIRAPDRPGPETAVVNVATGNIVATQPVEALDSWASDDALVGWGCLKTCRNEFHSQLVMVSLNGKHITPLGAPVIAKSDKQPNKQWFSLWTRR